VPAVGDRFGQAPDCLRRSGRAGTVRPSSAASPVATKRSASTASSASTKAATAAADGANLMPEQALALVGMGLMQKMAANGELPWMWSETEDGGSCDVAALRQRLELTQLALSTGAPLSTAEVTYLMGARPGAVCGPAASTAMCGS